MNEETEIDLLILKLRKIADRMSHLVEPHATFHQEQRILEILQEMKGFLPSEGEP